MPNTKDKYLKEREEIKKIIEDDLLGAIIDKYTHQILNGESVAKEATEDIMDFIVTLLDKKEKEGYERGVKQAREVLVETAIDGKTDADEWKGALLYIRMTKKLSKLLKSK